MSVSCECCVLSGTDACVGLITLPEDSECDREISMTIPWTTRALSSYGRGGTRKISHLFFMT
jgi:hypothetical protein